MSFSSLQHEFKDKTVAVVGYGVFGRSALDFIQQCDPSKLAVLDDNPEVNVPKTVEVRTGEEAFTDLSEFDLVVRSPGFQPERLRSANEVATDTNLLLRYFKNNVVGITGTKGKSTTVKITAALLEAAGQDVIVAGNIGRSYFDVFGDIKEDTVVVAELSSYQLSDAEASPHWALVLPIASDHLTWHGSQEKYEQAKARIFRYQSEDDQLIYWGEGASRHLVEAFEALSQQKTYPAGTAFRLTNTAIVFTGEGEKDSEYEIVQTQDLQLKGEHNFYNIIGSLSIVAEILREKDIELGQSVLAEWGNVLRGFEPLQHHLEDVATVQGVNFVDDSYASTPVATEAALKTISGPKVLIFGGQSRELELSSVINLLSETEVETVVLIGADESYIQLIESRISETSKTDVITPGDAAMDQIVRTAFERAEGHGSVVLSPGHPSFDMFDNFIDRGEQFQRAVQSLADETS